MTSDRLLFLDIDGVLNSVAWWRNNGGRLALGSAQALDYDAISRLNWIVRRARPGIVLSSTWRGLGRPEDVARVQRTLTEAGFRGELLGCTPLFTQAARADEIGVTLRTWLPRPPERFVVLDDDADAWGPGLEQRGGGRFIHTDYRIGLTHAQAEAAIDWFLG